MEEIPEGGATRPGVLLSTGSTGQLTTDNLKELVDVL